MNKLKTDKITAIHPDGWPCWDFVTIDDDTYTDSDWPGCDYRTEQHNLAVDIHITGRKAKWNGITYETRARITFVKDGEPDVHLKGKVYSTEPLTNGD